jgi:hypothetical protein
MLLPYRQEEKYWEDRETCITSFKICNYKKLRCLNKKNEISGHAAGRREKISA